MARCVPTAVIVVALAVSGCSGGADKRPQSPAPSKGSPMIWQPGEYPSSLDLCDPISADTLRRLRIKESSREHRADGCGWRDRDNEVRGVERELVVREVRFGPPPEWPDKSATDEARGKFQRPDSSFYVAWEFGAASATPLPGFGDEATFARDFEPRAKHSRVSVAVRLRNLIFIVSMEVSAESERGISRVPPLGDLEDGAIAATRDVLTRLGRPAAPTAPPAPGYQQREVQRVGKVCGAVKAARRLVPGVTGLDVSTRDSALQLRCCLGDCCVMTEMKCTHCGAARFVGGDRTDAGSRLANSEPMPNSHASGEDRVDPL